MSLGATVTAVDPAADRLRAATDAGAVAAGRLPEEPFDAIVVATPATDHPRTAEQALERTRTLFVEKPLATTAAAALRLAESAAAAGSTLSVGYNLRSEPALRTVRDTLPSGRIGRVLYARFEFGQHLADWRPGHDYRDTITARSSEGGGILLEASHELDALHWLCGRWSRVRAAVRRRGDLEIDVEDTVAAVVDTEDGVLVEVHLDMVRRGYARRATFAGTTGTIEWDLDGGATITSSSGREVLAQASDRNEMYVAEMRELLDGVRDRRRPRVSGDDAVEALRLAEAIRRASDEERTIER